MTTLSLILLAIAATFLTLHWTLTFLVGVLAVAGKARKANTPMWPLLTSAVFAIAGLVLR